MSTEPVDVDAADGILHGTVERPPRRERSLLWYVGRGISLGLLAILLLLAVLVIVVPTVTGAQRFTITGGSMEPSIPLGSLVVVKPTPIEDFAMGDVVTFQLQSGEPEVATHRVVGIGFTAAGDRVLTTKGDANAVEDSAEVRAEQIRGRVWYVIPGLGWINAVLTGPIHAWVLPAVAIVLFGYAGWMYTRAWAERRQRRRREAAEATAPASATTEGDG
jgi:signal peptidase I